MAKEFKHKGWSDKPQARRGATKSNRNQASKKRLTHGDGDSIQKEEAHMSTQVQEQDKGVTGPVFYRCLSDPGDVKQRNPGEPVPFCRYCGFRMVVVGMTGREKRDRM